MALSPIANIFIPRNDQKLKSMNNSSTITNQLSIFPIGSTSQSKINMTNEQSSLSQPSSPEKCIQPFSYFHWGVDQKYKDQDQHSSLQSQYQPSSFYNKWSTTSESFKNINHDNNDQIPSLYIQDLREFYPEIFN